MVQILVWEKLSVTCWKLVAFRLYCGFFHHPKIWTVEWNTITITPVYSFKVPIYFFAGNPATQSSSHAITENFLQTYGMEYVNAKRVFKAKYGKRKGPKDNMTLADRIRQNRYGSSVSIGKTHAQSCKFTYDTFFVKRALYLHECYFIYC